MNMIKTSKQQSEQIKKLISTKELVKKSIILSVQQYTKILSDKHRNS